MSEIKITESQVQQRVSEMLKLEWNVVLSSNGASLNEDDEVIQALHGPINHRFADVGVVVNISELAGLGTVGDLVSLIWSEIPEEHRA